MEIDIYALMEETDFKKILTIKKLHEITGKDIKECANIVNPYYEIKNVSSEQITVEKNNETDTAADILYLILEEIRESNRKLENLENSIQEIIGIGLYNSITDICDKIDSAKEDIQGTGLYNSIADICDKIDNLG